MNVAVPLGLACDSGQARATAAKTKPKQQVWVKNEEFSGEEEADDWMRWDQVLMMETDEEHLRALQRETLTQARGKCGQGEVRLHRHLPTGHLLWKCDHRQCLLFWHTVIKEIAPAPGTFVCPTCQSHEMMVTASMSEEMEETELQCMNQECNHGLYLRDIPGAYARLGKFNTDLLIPSS